MKFLPAERNSGFDVSQWVKEQSKMKTISAKWIARAIADRYNPEKKEVFPSIETIMEDTGCSRQTVVRAIKEMEESGEWIVIHGGWNKAKNENFVNRYIPLAWKEVPMPDGSIFTQIEAQEATEGELKAYVIEGEVEATEDNTEAQEATQPLVHSYEELTKAEEYQERLNAYFPGYFTPELSKTTMAYYLKAKDKEAVDVLFHYLAATGAKDFGRSFNNLTKNQKHTFKTLVEPTLAARKSTRISIEGK